MRVVADDQRETAGTDRPPGPLRAAVGIVGLESLALVAAAVVLLVKTIVGSPNQLLAAVSLAVIALVAAAVLALCGRALLRLRPAARTPVVLLQLLALPVSFDLAFQAGRLGYGAPILVAALAVLFLLFTPPVRAVLDRQM